MVSERVSRVLRCVHYQAFYFIYYGGYIPFLLYFPIYLKHIGLTATNVGIISGVRPMMQSVATPLLTLISDRLKSRKLLFIASCLIAITKLICLFLLLKPSHQRCVVTIVEYTNNTPTVLKHSSYVIKHKLSKREVMHRWLSQEKDLGDPRLSGNFDQNIGKIQRPYQENVLQSVHNHENGVQNENKSTKVMNESVSEILGRNNTLFNPNKTRPEYHTTTIKNYSETQYHIVNNENEVSSLFYSLLIVVLIFDMFDAAAFTLVDHSCIDHSEQDYGLTRLWGTLGWGFMAPAIAVVLHHASHEVCGHIVDTYHYVFIFAIVFFNVSLLIGSHIDLYANFNDVKVRKVHGTRSNFHYGIFLIVFAYAGFCNGFLFTFVNWFIESIGGNAGIMGMAAGCKCVADVVLYFGLKKIIDRLGHVPTVSLGLVGHIGLFFAFSRTTNPWIVVPIEFFHAICFGFLVSTCAYFLDQSVPAGSNVRLQGMFHHLVYVIFLSRLLFDHEL